MAPSSVISPLPVVSGLASSPGSPLSGTSMSPSVRSAKKQALSKLKDLVWDTSSYQSGKTQPLPDSHVLLASKQVIDLTDEGRGSVTSRVHNPVSPLANRKALLPQHGSTLKSLKRPFAALSDQSFDTESEGDSDGPSPTSTDMPVISGPKVLTQAPSGRPYRLWSCQYLLPQPMRCLPLNAYRLWPAHIRTRCTYTGRLPEIKQPGTPVDLSRTVMSGAPPKIRKSRTALQCEQPWQGACLPRVIPLTKQQVSHRLQCLNDNLDGTFTVTGNYGDGGSRSTSVTRPAIVISIGHMSHDESPLAEAKLSSKYSQDLREKKPATANARTMLSRERSAEDGDEMQIANGQRTSKGMVSIPAKPPSTGPRDTGQSSKAKTTLRSILYETPTDGL